MFGIDVVAFVIVGFAACGLAGMVWEDLKRPDRLADAMARTRRELSSGRAERFSAQAAREARGPHSHMIERLAA